MLCERCEEKFELGQLRSLEFGKVKDHWMTRFLMLCGDCMRIAQEKGFGQTKS